MENNYKKAYQNFDKFDKNGDGRLDRDETRKLLFNISADDIKTGAIQFISVAEFIEKIMGTNQQVRMNFNKTLIRFRFMH